MTSPFGAKLCFLCPGQGAQSPGMGRALLEGNETARALLQTGSDATGKDLLRLCLDADAETINRTENAQLALFALGAAAADCLAQKGIHPDGVAGFSLGECTALYVAGVLTAPEAFRLVAERGRLMQEASDRGGGAMCAILGMDEAEVVALARDSGAEAVNFNCPGQTVIAGTKAEVDALAAACRAHGAKRTVPLPVSGAFHTDAMKPAAEALAKLLRDFRPKPPRIPVYCNRTARPMPPRVDLAAHLAAQMTSPVLWRQTLEECHREGYRHFCELYPGKTLTGFVRKTLPDAVGLSYEKLSSGTHDFDI